MNGTRYGGAGLKGSVSGGFTTTELRSDFGVELDQQDPLPPGCEF
jgi:hypothetical protein